MKTNYTIDMKEYFETLNKIKDSIKETYNKSLIYVNSEMILNYYNIGKEINEKKIWGNKFIERLSDDLSEFGKGYSRDNLYRMKQFANEFTLKEIMEQPVPQIPWGTILTIMKQSNSHDEVLYYINKTYKHKWSRSTVLEQFKMKAYERSLIEPITTEVVKSNPDIKQLFKDTVVFIPDPAL